MLCTSPPCHLSTNEISSQYLEQSWGCAPAKNHAKKIFKGLYLSKQTRVVNLGFCNYPCCHITMYMYKVSWQYLAGLWRYTPEKSIADRRTPKQMKTNSISPNCLLAGDKKNLSHHIKTDLLQICNVKLKCTWLEIFLFSKYHHLCSRRKQSLFKTTTHV